MPTATSTPTATNTPTQYTDNESATASKIPWSGWYWPLPQYETLPNMYDPNGPLEKYDAYVLATRGNNPGALEWELDKHASGEGWSGHCHAWAAAAIFEPEPKAVTREGIKFTQDQVEGLLTETYNSPGWKYWGTPCEDCSQTSTQFQDVTPADLDMVMREYMGNQRKNVILDIDPGTPIWNYPAYKYARTAVVNGDVQEVSITITIAVPKINVGGTSSDTMRYTYILREGTPGEWTGASVTDHPDFIWVPTSRYRGDGRVNTGIKYTIVQEIINGAD
jgi:hypothetical protein